DAGVGVVGPVAGHEDVADGRDVTAGGLADGDHGASSRSSGASSSRASRAARGARCGIETCSWLAWAPSPTAPSPSRVGTCWLTLLPSEAPPTAACPPP